MPKDALPEGYVIGSDNQSPLMRFKKKIQIALAAGPRSHGIWKWREIPKTLVAFKGSGDWRYENTDGTYITTDDKDIHPVYISRIQPWARWGVVLQWPLFFNFWWIYKLKNVALFPTYKSSFGIKRMVTGGIGAKRDSDRVYWATANFGGNFE